LSATRSVGPGEVEDAYAGSEVPGELRSLRRALESLTMRFGDEIERVAAGAVVRVAPDTIRNEHDEPVEMWALSQRIEEQDATEIEGFWE
jgi:hypothetical protein